MMRMHAYGLLVSLLVSAFATDGALAQAYPTKPIRIHTAGAGSGPDLVARLVAAEISVPLGQPVIIENRPAGVILASGVAKSAPDGYTLLVTGNNLWVAPLLGEVPYDYARDFSPIAALARAPSILVVHPTLPVKTVTELIKLAKSRPGEFNYATGSTGSISHTASELFKFMAGVDMVRIAYKDQASETAGLLSGQIQISFGAGTSMPLIRAGKLRALAVGSPQRSVFLSDVATVAETLPGFAAEALVTLLAPAKTPDAIIRRLNQEAIRALQKPEVRVPVLNSGQEVAAAWTPEELADKIRADIANLGNVFKSSAKPGAK